MQKIRLIRNFQAAELIRRRLRDNKHSVILLSALIILGAAAGAVIYSFLSTEAKNKIFSYIQNYFYGSVLLGVPTSALLRENTARSLIDAAVYILGGIFKYILPLALLRLTMRGLTLGYTLTFFLCRYGIKGAAFGSALIILRLPPLLVSAWSIITLQAAAHTPRGRIRASATAASAYILFCLIWSLFECAIGSGLIRTLYSIMS